MLKQLIEEQNKEFDEKYPFLNTVKFTPFNNQDYEKAKYLHNIYTNLGDKIKYDFKQSQIDLIKAVVDMVEDNIILEISTHRIGSHSDDYGGESDLACECDLKERQYKKNSLNSFKNRLLEELKEIED